MTLTKPEPQWSKNFSVALPAGDSAFNILFVWHGRLFSLFFFSPAMWLNPRLQACWTSALPLNYVFSSPLGDSKQGLYYWVMSLPPHWGILSRFPVTELYSHLFNGLFRFWISQQSDPPITSRLLWTADLWKDPLQIIDGSHHLAKLVF